MDVYILQSYGILLPTSFSKEILKNVDSFVRALLDFMHGLMIHTVFVHSLKHQ